MTPFLGTIDGFSGIETELLRLLRNPRAATADDPGASSIDPLISGAEWHGITALLAARFADVPPTPFSERLRSLAQTLAGWELGHRHAVRDALESLAAAGVEPVIFKGTALAYSLYASPVLRMRGDTDMIVPPHERGRVTDTLLRRGFALENAVESGESSFVREGPGGSHGLDVHWRMNNSEVLARLFTYAELRAEAVSLPALGPDALAASPVDALLLACVHRGTHRHNPYYVSGEPHVGGNRLIWLYDLHLLAGSFSERDWHSFLSRAATKGLLGVCADGLALARACFSTGIPDAAWATLASPRSREPASDYLRAGPWRQQWLDFQALPGNQRKAHFLRELVFPSAEYMRSKYVDERVQWLPWLYARRAFAGAWRRLNGRAI